MRELAAGVYNLMKGTQQHALPVGEFMDRLSASDEDVEANLSTVFTNMRGSKQYWFLKRSEINCMMREYGPPTLFITLSCAEYESVEISNYLKKEMMFQTVFQLENCSRKIQYLYRGNSRRNSMTFSKRLL